VLQELAARTGAATWAIASMLFFLGVWLAIAWRVWRTRPEELEARARLVLGDDEDGGNDGDGPAERSPGAGTKA
jgi:hypothetical protein